MTMTVDLFEVEYNGVMEGNNTRSNQIKYFIALYCAFAEMVSSVWPPTAWGDLDDIQAAFKFSLTESC